MANPGYMRLVGHRPIIGRPWTKHCPKPSNRDISNYSTRSTPAAKLSWRPPHPILFRPSPAAPVTPCYLDFVYQPFKDADGKVSGIFVEGVD